MYVDCVLKRAAQSILIRHLQGRVIIITMTKFRMLIQIYIQTTQYFYNMV